MCCFIVTLYVHIVTNSVKLGYNVMKGTEYFV